ncbi:MAG: cupin domain-containing protein [Myxococcota bacterium]
MSADEEYDIQLAPLFEGLQTISVESAKKLSDHPWFNRTLCRVNESLVRIGVFKGEFHWHAHEREDEFFYVVDGQLDIEIEGRGPIRLGPNEGTLVPKGVRHRPVALKGATVLMVETASIVPTGS